MHMHLLLWFLCGLLVLSTQPLAAHEAKRLFDAGIQAYKQGKVQDAVTQPNQAIASYPDYAQNTFEIGALAKPNWGELRITVVDASGAEVNVPLSLFDAAEHLLQETSASALAEAPLRLAPGTYTVAITNKVRQAVRIEGGKRHRIELGRIMLALPLDSPNQSQPWTPFDLAEPTLHTPWDRFPYMRARRDMLQRTELLNVGADESAQRQAIAQLLQQSLATATEVLEAQNSPWRARLLAVQTLAELAEAEAVPRLEALLMQRDKDTWTPIKVEAARGLARLQPPAGVRAVFRTIFTGDQPKAKRAVATVAAAENFIEPLELFPVLRPLLAVESERRSLLNLLASMDLPLVTLRELAQELPVYNPPDFPLLFNLARHGDARAFQALRESLHHESHGYLARHYLIRLVQHPLPLIEGGLVIKARLSRAEQGRTWDTLEALTRIGWRKVVAVTGLLRDLARESRDLGIIARVASLLLEQYDVSGIHTLATEKAADQAIANERALLVAELGVGSHLRLLEQWMRANLTALAQGEKQEALLRLLPRQAQAVGGIIASPHRADSERARAYLQGYLTHQDPFVRLTVTRGLLFGLQAQHRKRTERGAVQSDLFYHYDWSDRGPSVFAPLFLALAPRASLENATLHIRLDRATDSKCYEAGGLIAFTCIDIREKPMWDGPQWPITEVTLLAPEGRRHRLPLRSEESGKLFAEFDLQASGVPTAWEGWGLEVNVVYMTHGQRTYRFDLPRLFR